jgi:chemotaxis protein MotA
MNIGSLIALFSGLFVSFVGVYLTAPNMLMFVDGVSAFIVFGGTLASTAISVRIPKMWILIKIFFYKMIKGQTVNFPDLIREIIQLSYAFSSGKDIKQEAKKLKDPFLKECIELYLDDLVTNEHYLKIINGRAKNMHKSLMLDVNRFKNIGKYPPAFGMLGTTMGMIVLLANLGGKDAMKIMGPAMAVCLITTFYGCLFSNIVVIPISENIGDSAEEIYVKNQIVVDGIKMILAKTPPAILAEELNSHLNQEDRLDWKEVLSV